MVGLSLLLFVYFHSAEGFLLLAKSNFALSLFWFFIFSPLSIGHAETGKNSLY